MRALVSSAGVRMMHSRKNPYFFSIAFSRAVPKALTSFGGSQMRLPEAMNVDTSVAPRSVASSRSSAIGSFAPPTLTARSRTTQVVTGSPRDVDHRADDRATMPRIGRSHRRRLALTISTGTAMAAMRSTNPKP